MKSSACLILRTSWAFKLLLRGIMTRPHVASRLTMTITWIRSAGTMHHASPTPLLAYILLSYPDLTHHPFSTYALFISPLNKHWSLPIWCKLQGFKSWCKNIISPIFFLLIIQDMWSRLLSLSMRVLFNNDGNRLQIVHWMYTVTEYSCWGKKSKFYKLGQLMLQLFPHFA